MGTRTPPTWWADLTTAPISRELGIAWRAPDQWDDEEPEQSFFGVMRTAAESALDERLRQGKLLVGTGPTLAHRLVPLDVAVHWYLDPEEPGTLWCSLGDCYPGWLWVPLAPEPGALAEVVSHSHPTAALDLRTLPGSLRAYLGLRSQVMVPNVYSGEMVPLNGLDLERYTAGVRFLEQKFWGSSQLDDPLADDLGPVAPVDLVAVGQGTQAQRLGRIPSMTWRTVHSRSYFSLEVHMQHAVCLSVRYRPTPLSHRAVVERVNAELGTDYPVDLPLDVIGAHSGFGYGSEARLERVLASASTPSRRAEAIRVLAMLWAGDLRRSRRLMEFAAESAPEVRRSLFDIAYWYGYIWLAEQLALTETDPEVVDELEDLIIGGGRDDTFNAFSDFFSTSPILIDGAGEPVETWGGDEDENDADEDEDEDNE